MLSWILGVCNRRERMPEERCSSSEDTETSPPPAPPLPAPQPDKSPHTVTNYVALPPDGGWGWVVVGASFLCNMVVDGIAFSFGVLLEHIAKEYGISTSKATITGSLLSGCYLSSGPFVSAIANRYGFRITGIIGSLIACTGFALGSFASNVETLWIFYGVIGGIGFGMIYVPAVITTGFYFERLRALATGISVTGSGIGTIVVGPATAFLIEYFGWRGALLVQAGVLLNCAVFSSMYRPLKRIHIPVESSATSEGDAEGEQDESGQPQVPLLQRIKIARDRLRKASISSIESEVGITAIEPAQTNHKFLKANNNIFYPRAIDALNGECGGELGKSLESLEGRDHRRQSHSEPKRKYDKNITLPMIEDNFDKPLKQVKPQKAVAQKKRKSLGHEYDPLKEYQTDDALLEEHIHDDVFYVPRKSKSERRDSITLKYRKRANSTSSCRSVRSTKAAAESAGVRPLYRDDIFFQASLHRLPQYQSYGSGLDYTLSVTRLPTSKDVEEEEDNVCSICPEAVRRTLATMLDLSLLLSPSFMLFAVAGFLTTMGLFTPFNFIADRGAKNGMDPALLIFLVSSIGITNTFGRILCGALTMLPQVDGLTLNNIALTVGGIATIFSGLSYSPTYQFAYAAIFGLSISFWGSLRSIVAVDLVGLDKLTNSFGILLLFQGMAAAIGSPIAGWCMDVTGSYDASFYLGGGMILASGVMCYPLMRIKAWEEARKKQKEGEPQV